MFKTHTEWNILASSIFQGIVSTTYNQMVEVYGQPVQLDITNTDGKVSVLWVIEFDNNQFAQVYLYKHHPDFTNPSVRDATFDWHIGGTNANIVNAVHGPIFDRFEFHKGPQ